MSILCQICVPDLSTVNPATVWLQHTCKKFMAHRFFSIKRQIIYLVSPQTYSTDNHFSTMQLSFKSYVSIEK